MADKAAFQIFADFATDIGFVPNRGSDFGSDRWLCPTVLRKEFLHNGAKAKDAFVVQVASHDLQPDRSAIPGETNGHRGGGQPGEIGERGKRNP